MDEQRLQAYLQLIQQLLACPAGEEASVLQGQAELVDAGLVEMMGLVADQMAAEGLNSHAESCRRVADQIAQGLGLSSAARASQETTQFVVEVMMQILRTQANPKQVYSFWNSNLGQLNKDFLDALPVISRWAMDGEADQSLLEFIVAAFSKFGDLIQKFPLRSPGLNSEMAIRAYEQVLKVYNRDIFPETWSPEAWANIQNNLANIYIERIEGEPTVNLSLAINAYKQALKIYTREAFPEQWAGIQNNLATTYDCIQEKRADNLEQAINHYKQALEVYTYEAFPEEWAATQNNLANAYRERIQGDQSENLEKAIRACERAMEVYTREDFPEQWAIVQNNFANVYRERIRGDRANNLEKALIAYKQALEVRTREAFPQDWAMTQNNLATTYSDRIRGDRADNLEQAISAYERALEVYTQNTFPQDWAMTQNNLATTYSDRIRGDREGNLEKAVFIYQQVLEVYSREAFPTEWAMTQNNLAIAYTQRIRGKKTDNLEQAISAYKQAARVYTRQAFPEKWAAIQNNLVAAYSQRIQDEKADNLEQAIIASKRALKVYTRDTFPEQWARTQNNLAAAYIECPVGKRTDNLKQAISACKGALQVTTREAFPSECRRTSGLLGDLQSELQNWYAATQAYEQALAAAEDLYQACTLLDSQAGELKATADLPRRAAYAYAKAGQLAKALETIERGRARGLSERLQRDRADLAQLQQQRPDLFDRYRDITNQLQNLESQQRDQRIENFRKSDQNENFLIPLTLEEHRNEAQKLRQDLSEAIAQIRQVPGYETFLQAPSLTEIQQNLSTEAPTVYLIPTPNGSLALIATPQAIDPLWLDAFPEATLTDLVQTWLNASQNQRNDFPGWLEAIDQGTRQLWDNLMAPLIDRLKQHNHTQAILIPTGLLGLLPLHAAWTPDPDRPTGRRYALDELTFTYAPNAQSLVAARAIAQRFPDSHLDSILAIDNPRQDLPSSEREVLAAVKTFPRPTILRHEKATTTTVATNLGQQAIVHFSCHGTANFNEPLNSGLVMNDDLLTLRELFALKLTEGDKHGIRLAVLSACETGLPGLDLADEAIGLPVGLLQAGVAGAIASLWAVNEQSTMILLTKFYDLWRNDHFTPPDALRQAQQWLRNATPAEIRQLTGIGLRGAEHPLAHPYYWAGFSYTGI